MNYKAMVGIVPGGIYGGIFHIPGDPNKLWTKGEMFDYCPACENGKLFYYWQNEYFHLKCEDCNYLHDTGIQLK